MCMAEAACPCSLTQAKNCGAGILPASPKRGKMPFHDRRLRPSEKRRSESNGTTPLGQCDAYFLSSAIPPKRDAARKSPPPPPRPSTDRLPPGAHLLFLSRKR